MNNYFLKDIFYLSIVRIFAFANIPLQTLIFANNLSSELIQYFFILSGLFSILIVFEGGAGTVLTYEYNRRLDNKDELSQILSFFRKRFYKLTLYYIPTAILIFYSYNYFFSGMLDQYFYPYILCVLLMSFNFNIYPVICISEGSGNVRQALLVKTITPLLSMIFFLIYVYFTKNIFAIFIIPVFTTLCYLIYVMFFCKKLAHDYYFGKNIISTHKVSNNVSKANVSWGAGYILTQGFPILLPFVLAADDAAKLILTANLLNAFLAFMCIGASIVGPRIPLMIEKNNSDYKYFIFKNLAFIYFILIFCLIFFDELLSIFYIFFNSEKFLDRDLLFLFCISFGYIPLFHFFVVFLKGLGIEPFVQTNVYVAAATALLILISGLFSIANFLLVYICFRLIFVLSIYSYKMLKYYTQYKELI